MANQRWITLSDLAKLNHPNLMLLHNACTTIIIWICSATQYGLNQSQLSTVHGYSQRIDGVVLALPDGDGTFSASTLSAAAERAAQTPHAAAAAEAVDLASEDNGHTLDDELDLGHNGSEIIETQSDSGSYSGESVIIIQGIVQATATLAHPVTEPHTSPS